MRKSLNAISPAGSRVGGSGNVTYVKLPDLPSCCLNNSLFKKAHRDWYWGHFFLSTVLGTLSPKKNVPNTVSVLGTLSLINTVLVLGTLSQFQY